MKKIWVFLLGVLTGIVILFAVLLVVAKFSPSNNENSDTPSISSNNGVTLFPEAGDCLSEKPFKVFQVLDTGVALATEYSDRIGGNEVFYGTNVLFYTEGKYYYDEEIIRVPQGKCVRQIGVYKYMTKQDFEKTVPIVTIMDK